jgi:hypothetical protein
VRLSRAISRTTMIFRPMLALSMVKHVAAFEECRQGLQDIASGDQPYIRHGGMPVFGPLCCASYIFHAPFDSNHPDPAAPDPRSQQSKVDVQKCSCAVYICVFLCVVLRFVCLSLFMSVAQSAKTPASFSRARPFFSVDK